MISFKLAEDIPKRAAKAAGPIPSGLRNSSRSISPGCVGGRFAGNRLEVRLVVIRDLDFVCITILPSKAHTILVVDSNTVLAKSVPAQPFKSIAWWNRQLSQVADTVELVKLATSDSPQLLRARRASTFCVRTIEHFLGPAIGE